MLLTVLHASKPIRFWVTILLYVKACSTQPEPKPFKTSSAGRFFQDFFKTSRLFDMRRYRSMPAATRLIRSSTRVPVGGTKRAAVDAVKPRKVHQGSGGKTYAWIPTSKPCCKRKCFECVTDPSDALVITARQPLFDMTLTRPELRSALTDNHLPGRPACVR